MHAADLADVVHLRFRSERDTIVATLAAVDREGAGAELLAWLTPAERERCASFPVEARQRSFLLGRIAAKAALLAAMAGDGAAPTDFEITRGAFEQPLLAGAAGAARDVSIAHVTGHAVALVHPRGIPMGIDVEPVHAPARPDVVEEAEQALVRHVIDVNEATACRILWTMKEALGKALRIGLGARMDVFQVEHVAREGARLVARYRSFPHFAATTWIQDGRITSIAYPRAWQLDAETLETRHQGRGARPVASGSRAQHARPSPPPLPGRAVVFMLSGQGSQYFHMGYELWRNDPVFRDVLERGDRRVRERSGVSVLATLYDARRTKADELVDIRITHPAIFLLEVALCEALRARGVRPDALLGVSLGELAAATVSGAIDFDQALDAVIEHARVIGRSLPAGTMLGVLAPPSAIESSVLLRDNVEIAAVPFPGHVIVSVLAQALPAVERELDARGLRHQRVMVAYPFHSSWMDHVRAELVAAFSGLSFGEPAIPCFSAARAARLQRFDAAHCWTAARLPMRFRETCDVIRASTAPLFVDLGPSGTLSTYLKYEQKSDLHVAALTPFGHDLRTVDAVVRAVAEFRRGDS